MAIILYSGAGERLILDKELGRGGEGSVFEIAGNPNHVAKIYHKEPDPKKQEKIRFMAESVDTQLLSTIAWPQATLHAQHGGPIQGFIMPKVAGGEPIHLIYNPAHRRQNYPNLTWSFLLHAARNVAAAFAAIHDHGHVVGDINQNSVIVNPDSRVILIDSDSFQINARGTLHHCEVGVSHFTPPELQKITTFANFERTANHDAFGMALLIFHLLYGGRHPYSGVPQTTNAGNALEADIAAFRYAYARDNVRRGFLPPPRSIPINLLPPDVTELLERSFTEVGVQRGRPTAREWLSALDAVRSSLESCRVVKLHTFPAHLRACPWCELEQVGAMFFPGGVSASKFVLSDAWRDIEAVPTPVPFVFSRPSANVTPRPMPPTPPPPALSPKSSIQRKPSEEGIQKPPTPTSTTSWGSQHSARDQEKQYVLHPKDLFEAKQMMRDIPWNIKRSRGRVPFLGLSLPINLFNASAVGTLAFRTMTVTFLLVPVAVFGFQTIFATMTVLIGIPFIVFVSSLLFFVPYHLSRRKVILRESRRLSKLIPEFEKEEAIRKIEEARRDEVKRAATAIVEEERRIRITVLQQAQRDYAKQYSLAQHEIDTDNGQFNSLRLSLHQAKEKYEHLESGQKLEIQIIEDTARDMQLCDYLRQLNIYHAKVMGLGEGRRSALMSFGIQTAADISYNSVIVVPGFGEELTYRMIDWRNWCAQSFRYDPSNRVLNDKVAAVKAKYNLIRSRIENELTRGPQRLQSLRHGIEARRKQFVKELTELSNALAQAEADYELVKAWQWGSK